MSEQGRTRKGRPRHRLVLQPPELVPMTAEQQKAAVRSLALLFEAWIQAQSGLGSEGQPARPKPGPVD
jgi:hypothetical protein